MADDPRPVPPTGPLPGPPPRMDQPGPRVLPAWTMPLIIVAIVIVAVVVMTRPTANRPPSQSEARVTVTDDGAYRLTLRTEHVAYAADTPVTAEASLAYLGPAPVIDVTTGPDLVLFSVVEVGGPRRVDAAERASCVSRSLERGVTTWYPWQPSGGFEGAEAADAWIRDYLGVGTRPEPPAGFWLPPGTWQLVASTGISEGGCGEGPFHSLEASVVVSVDADASVDPSP